MTEFHDYRIEYDEPHSSYLNGKIRDQFAPKGPRTATHVSDLLYCLRQAWAKKRLVEDGMDWRELEPDEDVILTWAGGLMFEDLIAEGRRNESLTYCWQCKAVGRLPNGPEQGACGVCGQRWLVLTPDYVVDGIIHEAKQTRKSRNKGPEDAPWWVDQLRSYLLFAKKAGWTVAPYGRLVVNYLMGGYGRSKKGWKPEPPRAALDSYKVIFDEEKLEEWGAELRRRQLVVEGNEMPPLSMPGDEHLDSPRYGWLCPSCPVGAIINCEEYIWDEEGREREDGVLVEDALEAVEHHPQGSFLGGDLG